MKPNLTEIKIEANDAEVDSFAACILAACRYWQREYDYDYIAGLTGSAFSPVWWQGESCTAWWTEFGNDTRVRFLGEALGFTVEESPEMTHEDFEASGEMSSELAGFWNRAKEAVQSGKVVIIGSWPCWSVIKSWDDDISEIGLESLAYLGGICAPHPLSKLYILTPAPADLTRMDAIKEAVRFGADIADGSFELPKFAFRTGYFNSLFSGDVDANQLIELPGNGPSKINDHAHRVAFLDFQAFVEDRCLSRRFSPCNSPSLIMRAPQKLNQILVENPEFHVSHLI